MYHGDIRLGDTIHIKFTTVNTSGLPTQLAGTPVVSAYPSNSTTQLTAGISLTVDFDGLTGFNDVTVIATSGNGYATATNYALVITTGTVGGSSVVGYVVGSFSIENRSGLMPTAPGRTLDVSATGEGDANLTQIAGSLVNVATAQLGVNAVQIAGTPQTTGDLAARIGIPVSSLANDIAAVPDAVWDEATTGHVTSGTFGQRMAVPRAGTAQAGAAGTITLDASASAVDEFYTNTLVQITSGTGVGQVRTISAYTGATKVASVTPNWVTTPNNTSIFVIIPMGAIAGASAPTAAQVADAVWDEARADHTSPGSFGEGTASVQGNVTGSVASVTGAVGSVTAAVTVGTINANVVTASALATDAVNEIADQVWDEALSGHLGAGSTGNALNAAGSAGDPWSTAIPGAYGAGTAGNIVGNNLNATVSSRLATAGYTAPDNTTIGTINTKVGTPAGASVSADIASVKTDTGTTIPGRLPAALVSGRMDASVGAMANDVVTAASLNADAVTEIFVGVLRTALSEGYAADGAQPTLEQMAYMLYSAVAQFAVTGTNISTKRIDGTTEAMVFTTDSSTAPTSRVRTS